MSEVVWREQCPVCLTEGHDSDGNNLTIFASGAYACAANPAHTKLVAKLRPDLVTPSSDFKSERPISKSSASKKAKPAGITASYPYRDASGSLVYEIRRDDSKNFWPYLPGATEPKLGDVKRVPYRLPEVLKAETVWIVEGEKDADCLAAVGIVATTRAGGSSRWEDCLTPWFKGKHVILCGDNDEPGRKYMDLVAAALEGTAKSIRRVAVPEPAKDISDHLEGLSDTEAMASVEALLAASDTVAKDNPCQDWIDFSAEQEALPDACEIVSGMIRRGEKVSIGGSSKSKKTFTCLDLVLSVASGTPWMGMATTKVPVVIVDMELRKKTLELRIKAILKARGITLQRGDLYIIPLRGKVTTAEKTLAYVKANCPKDVGVFLIDPFYKLAAGKDENAAGDITSIMNLIDDLGREFDATILYSAHYSKGNQSAKESIDRISGSGVFGRDADTIISLTAHEEADCFAIDPIFRSFAPMDPWVVRWNYPLMERADGLDPAKLKQIGGRPPEHSPEDLLKLVQKPVTGQEWERLALRVKIGRSTYFNLRRQLVTDGRVVQTEGSKLWSRTNAV